MYSIAIIVFLALAYLTTMLVIVQTKKDNSIGNFTWGGLVMLLTLCSFFMFSSFLPRQILATILVMLWGIRLSYYTYLRYQKGIDPRFLAWQQQHGKYALLFGIGWVMGLGGFMGVLMSLPILAINTSSTPCLTWLDGIATVIWIIGFYWESVSDYQLYLFRKNPANRGAVLKTGLWRYSRHPNYFGEIVMWWALYLIAIAVPYGWLTIATPIAITTTLVFVTGIPWIENAMANNTEYQEYKKRTSILIPLPTK